MKHSLKLLLMLLISINIQAQNKNIGYVTLEGTYNEKYKTYDENNIAGLILTFEQLKYNDGLTTVKIEFKDGPVTLINEYIVIKTIMATNDIELNIYIMKSIHKETIILKYNNNEFELWSNCRLDNNMESKWLNYFVGVFIN